MGYKSQPKQAMILLCVRLWTDWPVDQFVEAANNNVITSISSSSPAASVPSPPASNRSIAINVVPGFDGTQLPLPRNEMPRRSLASRSIGYWIVERSVCLARDTDNDGLADTWEPISDDVPAPYGLAAVDSRSMYWPSMA